MDRQLDIGPRRADGHAVGADLVGPGVAVNSASFTGDTSRRRTVQRSRRFRWTGTGIVLSSGDVHDVIGPNEFDNTGQDLRPAGDSRLDAHVPSGQTTRDAASLTVNFTPTNPQLAINYVFASEEYQEFVDTEFNDVFGFFVNGVNCAFTPGTDQPITVNTVNQNTNSLFYVPNETGDLRHRIRRLHRGPHVSRRGESRRERTRCALHCRCQRRHPRLGRVPSGERCLVEPDRTVAADHAKPPARHP